MQDSLISNFIEEVELVRRRLRSHLNDGSVTPRRPGNRQTVIKLLNEALAAKLVFILRHQQEQFTAVGNQADPVSARFVEHAREEQVHANLLAGRIRQLGGDPDVHPVVLRGRGTRVSAARLTLVDMVRENLAAERIAIDAYSQIVWFIGETDPTTSRVLEEILAKEEEHALDLADLLTTLGPLERTPAPLRD